MIRVVVVDDHELVRVGMRYVFDAVDDIEVVGAAGDGRAVVGVVRDTRPDVVLMDLAMPNVDGIEAIRRLRGSIPATRVVAFTSFYDRERILAALDAGAVGYLLKDAQPDELVEGVRAAAAGTAPLSPKAVAAMIGVRSGRSPQDRFSDRERAVLRLVAKGASTQQIAHELASSPDSVKRVLTKIFRQIGVTDRLQAALWARRHGLGDKDD
jgi:DNA-binding NarL/FixJ family response regulator